MVSTNLDSRCRTERAVYAVRGMLPMWIIAMIQAWYETYYVTSATLELECSTINRNW